MDNEIIPSSITRYFWGDDLTDLSIKGNLTYIVQTLLEIGNSDAIKWLFSTLDKSTIITLLPTLKLSKKSAHFWRIYLT